MKLHRKTKAQKQKIHAKWNEGTFQITAQQAAQSDQPLFDGTEKSSRTDSVIFDRDRVRLVYKDISISLIATCVIAFLLASAYAMMRF